MQSNSELLKQHERLVAGIKRQVFRKDDPYAKKADAIFKALRPKALTDGDYTCIHCGLRSEKLCQIHHLDDNHHNNDPSNYACICPWCHAYHHIGEPSKNNVALSDGCLESKQTRLIILPGISPQDFNSFQRALGFAFINKDKAIVNRAKKLYSAFGNAQMFGQTQAIFGSSKASDLAAGLSNLTQDEYERAQLEGEILDQVRVLFSPGLLAQWARLLAQEHSVMAQANEWAPRLERHMQDLLKELGVKAQAKEDDTQEDDEAVVI